MKPLAIYIHVPFCARKCAYCDFASWPGHETDWSLYFEALRREIGDWGSEGPFGRLRDEYRVRSLFIGGGTPTLVPAAFIEDTIDQSRSIAEFDPDAEITLEGNPGTLTPEKLAAYRRAGVNRLSLGAQSFDDDLLRSLGRIHTAAQIGEAVAMARDAGFANINLDLMYALPGQTTAQWLDTLERAIDLGVEHLSAYSLIVEPGTPMADRVARGEAAIPEEDAVNAMQRAAIDRLAKADYGRYEISNYAKPGFECRHNLTYWLRGDYLGLGCAAHSMLAETRFSNPSSLEAYLGGARMQDVKRLMDADAAEETLMLSTRLTRGVDLREWTARFGAPLEARCANAISRLARAGFVECERGFLRLTPRGLEVQEAVVLELLSGWE